MTEKITMARWWVAVKRRRILEYALAQANSIEPELRKNRKVGAALDQPLSAHKRRGPARRGRSSEV